MKLNMRPESEWDVPYVLRLGEQRDGLAAALNQIHRTLAEDADGKPSNRDGTGDWAKAGREARALALAALAEAGMEIQT